MTTANKNLMGKVIACEKRNIKDFVRRVLPTMIVCVVFLVAFKIL